MYNNLIIEQENRTMEEICKPAEFAYQKHQKFIKRWFENGNKKMLLFHGIGSGKTCSSILVLKALMDKSIKNIYVATPAALQSNYENEMKSACGKMKTIPKKVTVFSHQKFIQFIHTKPKVLDNSLVIIDEIQNIVSAIGSSYRVLLNNLVCKNPKNSRVVLLSGTPMFDKPYEIAMTLNLLDLPQPLEGPAKKFNKEYISGTKLINTEKFSDKINGYVSAFRGIGPNAYAKQINKTFKLDLDPFQGIAYANSVGDKVTAFYLESRQAINCVYPNGKWGTKGRKNVSKAYLLEGFKGQRLKKHSIKFYTCVQHLKSDSCVGPVFVYSNLVNAGGIMDFAIALQANGFEQYVPKIPKKKKGAKESPQKMSKKPKFAIFKSNAKAENDAIVKLFNSPENKDGSLIKVMIGSPSMKEGVSLKNTREVHLFEPYWNMSRTKQIIGRAIRFCSHVTLPAKDRNVVVYNYIGLTDKVKKTVDEKILDMARRKQTIINKFENLLYTSSVDCKLFYNANGVQRSACVDNIKNSKNINRPVCKSFPCKMRRGASGACRESRELAIKRAVNVHGINLARGKAKAPKKHPIKLEVEMKNGNRPMYFKKFPELNNIVDVKVRNKKGKNNNNNIVLNLK